MSLFRFVRPDSSMSPHSNELANAADNGRPTLGSVSPESFTQRKHTDRNRKHISRFRDAGVHRDFRAHHRPARIVQPEHEKSEEPKKALDPMRSTVAHPSRTIPRTTGGYREPQSRRFNPFR